MKIPKTFLVLATLFAVQCVLHGIYAEKCSYEACNEWAESSETLNIHVIPHTHDDMGWLKNVDEYFWGDKNYIARAGVQYILNTVIQGLEKDPKRRFSYCETGFFWRWLQQQSDFTRHQVKRLINEGQLEFINGGWTQNDEAAAFYVDMIDQTTFGHKKLNQTFGKCARPTVTWQVDPFGHSRENANLFAQMGFDATFFARIHFKDKEKRLANKSMEMLWSGSDNGGASSDIFTHSFYWWYYPPPGFCWDCDDPPIMDDPRLSGYNLDSKIVEFLTKVTDEAKHYRHNHALILMGGDFQWQNADIYWSNIEKLIKAIDGKAMPASIKTPYKNVSMFYSTPSCYIKAVNSIKELTFPSKNDDFFPYASGAHQYWTGYFTSRPALKRQIRQTSGFLQLCKQMDALALLNEYDVSDMDVISASVALNQHHDAVTGTAKQAVTYDYQKRLSTGLHECQQVLNDAQKKFFGERAPQIEICPQLNISVCPPVQNQTMITVTVFNPLAQTRDVQVSVPFDGASAHVVEHTGFFQLVPSQVSSVWPEIHQQIQYENPAAHEVHFVASQIKPLGFRTFLISSTSKVKKLLKNRNMGVTKDSDIHVEMVTDSPLNTGIVLENEKLKVEFDQNNLLKKVTNKIENISKEISQNFMWYAGMGPSFVDNQPSGAYVFRPNGTAKVSTAGKLEITFINGTLVQEIRQKFNPWISQSIRLWKNSDHLELNWLVGPIPIGDLIGKEIVTRFTSNMDTQQYFYTESNGRQFLKRKLNYQPTYEFEHSEPISGNYYPVTSAMFIKLHRRLLYDDNYGVAEPLLEPGPSGKGLVAKGTIWLALNKIGTAPGVYRRKMLEMYKGKEMLGFSRLQTRSREFKNEFSGLNRDLPNEINLLTLEQWQTSRSVLIRLENVFQGNEGKWAKNVSVDLSGLFTTFEVSTCKQLTLSANRLLCERQRLKWKHEMQNEDIDTETDGCAEWQNHTGQFSGGDENYNEGSGLVYVLKPMDIVTLQCEITAK